MDNRNGWVIIGTKLDSKQFEKDLANQQRELKKYEKEAEQLLTQKTKAEEKLKPYEDELALIQETTDEMLKQAQTKQEVDNILEIEQRNVEELNNKYSTQIEKLNTINKQLTTNATKQDLLKTKIGETTSLLSQARNYENINNSIKSVERSIGGVVKKVVRWGLAVFGIRGAYMAVRNAINVISQGDEQLKADLNYIKNIFAYALEPVVRRIVELAKTLVYYIGYLINAWFKYDIFANANKNLKKATGSAKDLKKQLAGFDEMNILSDNSGGGGATSKMNLDDFDAPNWLKLVGKYGKVLLPILGGIFGKLFKIKRLGIAIALYGIYETIKAIIDFAHDPNFKNFVGILEGIAITVIGIGVAIGSWPVILGGAIALIVLTLVKNIDKVRDAFKTLNAWLDEHVFTWLQEHFGVFGEFIYSRFKDVLVWLENTFVDVLAGIKRVVDGVVKIFNGDLWGGIADIFGGLFDILIAPFKEWYYDVKKKIIDLLDMLGLLSKKTVYAGGGAGAFGGGGSAGGRAKGGIFYPSKLPKLAVGGIINQPGRGIPYHGAYIGERGAEAVVPLTDSQQMALLGETIGRYVNINATVPVYVGNRMVARELKRINAEDNFAYNR